MTLDDLLEGLLSGSEVVDHETKGCVQIVVVVQLLVHGVGSLSERHDLHFTWSDVSAELFDLIVEHELELFELLGLLLQVKDRFLLEGNFIVLIMDLLMVFKRFEMLSLGFLLLVLELHLFVFDLPVYKFDFSCDILELVSLVLELCG